MGSRNGFEWATHPQKGEIPCLLKSPWKRWCYRQLILCLADYGRTLAWFKWHLLPFDKSSLNVVRRRTVAFTHWNITSNDLLIIYDYELKTTEHSPHPSHPPPPLTPLTSRRQISKMNTVQDSAEHFECRAWIKYFEKHIADILLIFQGNTD